MGLLMDEMDWMHRVINLRHRLGVTQEGLAEMLGISRATIPMWEARAARPYSKAAELFAALESEINDREEEAS